ncbi:non-homologous end-joining DNA ligase [Desmospora profundinema]|uniref:Bifunctional non-homologous end joining protein LigD n=1 Tax=Desmospora profundinema TaxID=1571184 RepID=A0ABU1II38_9BACL|nr:non-homologous end-joining DNA ligase [Desmospora profundinema]MDR6224442.1 bifunctional non-homologous end joining protein LigD [Desmospora profundinema]
MPVTAKTVTVDGKEIRISNPDKVLFKEIPLTKWDWIMHLTRLAPYLIPHCRGRFLTTIRFPDGPDGKSFYQKNAPSHIPDWMPVSESGKIRYMRLEDTAGLIYLGNLACLEYHLSFDRITHPDQPSDLVFDIDPSQRGRVGFQQSMETALLTRETLRSLGLDGVVKTSGATGLQIYVPLKRGYTFEETRQVSRFISQYLTERHPHLITVERMVSKRGTKVYFDYLQHWRGKSLIAPYSPRAREEATVSTPVHWEELRPSLRPECFTLSTIHRRLARVGDLFAPLLQKRGYTLDEILSFIGKKG